MTEAMSLSLVAILPTTLASIAALVVSIKNSKKADQIHVLVNNQLTEIKAQLSSSNERADNLENLLLKVSETKKIRCKHAP